MVVIRLEGRAVQLSVGIVTFWRESPAAFPLGSSVEPKRW